MSGLRVSAVIVVHNGERYLGEAIDSALTQAPAPIEVLVIDDGSTDGSRAIAERFGPPVRSIPIGRRGIGGARNVGVTESRGECVAFLDSDDLWTPACLRVLSEAFVHEPELQVGFGHVRQFISPDLDPAASARLRPRDDLEPGYLVGAALIRRQTLAEIGPFHEDLATGDFIDWTARAREAGVRERLVGEHVLWRRVHETNHGIVHADKRGDYARILKRALDRRRAAIAESGAEQIVERERPATGE
jgi:glycosyltransferase involved in cell wall biosynthesis